MRYAITGAHAKTGAERAVTLEADDEKTAVALAKQQGVLPYSVQPDCDSGAPAAPLQPKAEADLDARTAMTLVFIVLGISAVLLLLLVCNAFNLDFQLNYLVLIPGVVASAILIPYLICLASMSPTERAAFSLDQKLGYRNDAMICPHCQTKGKVRAKGITQKAGISGAKATGAILTGGVSVLAAGLSRKEDKTQAHCDNCGSTWTF